MKRIVFVLMVTLITRPPSTAQPKQKISARSQLGRPLPSSAVSALGDRKPKLVIGYTWSVGCPPCIESFPKLDSIKKVFGDSIEILLSNHTDTEETIRKRSEQLNIPPSLIRLSQEQSCDFSKSFPRHWIPDYTWIYNGGMVGITGPEYATVEIIRSILTKDTIVLPLNEHYVGFVREEGLDHPAFPPDIASVRARKGRKRNRHHSRLLNSIPQFGRHDYISEDSTLFYTANTPLKKLVQIGFYGFQYRPTSQGTVVLDLSREDSIWFASKLSSCEIKFDVSKRKRDLFSYLRKDLVRMMKKTYGITAQLEHRMIMCTVLKKGQAPEQTTRESFPVVGTYEEERKMSFKEVKNLLSLASLLSKHQTPLVDESGVRDDAEIITCRSDGGIIDRITAALTRLGYTQAQDLRMHEVIVIKKVK